MDEAAREAAYAGIVAAEGQGVRWAVQAVDHARIDEINILQVCHVLGAESRGLVLGILSLLYLSCRRRWRRCAGRWPRRWRGTGPRTPLHPSRSWTGTGAFCACLFGRVRRGVLRSELMFSCVHSPQHNPSQRPLRPPRAPGRRGLRGEGRQ